VPLTSLEDDVPDDVALTLAVCEPVPVALLLLVTEPVGVVEGVCKTSKRIHAMATPGSVSFTCSYLSSIDNHRLRLERA